MFCLNRRGFTLLELCVVIALVALTAAFVLPRISSTALTGSSLEQSTLQLGRFIAGSAQYAVRNDQSYLLAYSANKNSFFLLAPNHTEDDSEQDNDLPSYELKEGVSVKDIQSYYRGQLAPGETHLLLSEKGYLEPALIHLQSDSGDELTLQLFPFLGDVEIHSGYEQFEKSSFQ